MNNPQEYIEGLVPGVIDQLKLQWRSKKYFSDPALWAKEYLGITLWPKQAEVAQAVVDNKNVACKAGHEVGKSFVAGVLICWWIDTRWQLPGGVFVVSTAPSTKQINAVVWREVRKFHGLSVARFKAGKVDHPLPGYITSQAHWRLPDGIELGYGTKPPEGKDDTMSGIHARYVLAVGDEAVGLSEKLIGDLANITSNATSRRFIIMNPTNPLSYAGHIFKEDTGTWKLMTISVLDSPNFHGGGHCDCPEHKDQPFGLGLPIEVLETLVDQTYVDDMARDHGIDSPTYISRVLGEFAWEMGPTLISMEDMAAGLDCDLIPDDDAMPILGVDVSRSEKGDMNTIYSCLKGTKTNDKGEEVEGIIIRYVDSWNDKSATRTEKRIHNAMKDSLSREMHIDGSGIGGPMADHIRDEHAKGDYLVAEMIGGETGMVSDKQRYYNNRAQWYAWFQEKLAKGLIDIDVEDKRLQEELLGIETKFPDSGVQKMLIESKKDMKKRGVSSPDHADACIYAATDISPFIDNPLRDIKPGTEMRVDPWSILQTSRAQMAIL